MRLSFVKHENRESLPLLRTNVSSSFPTGKASPTLDPINYWRNRRLTHCACIAIHAFNASSAPTNSNVVANKQSCNTNNSNNPRGMSHLEHVSLGPRRMDHSHFAITWRPSIRHMGLPQPLPLTTSALPRPLGLVFARLATTCDCHERTFHCVGISSAGPWHHGGGACQHKKSQLSILGRCAPCTSIPSKGSSHVSDLWRHETQTCEHQT